MHLLLEYKQGNPVIRLSYLLSWRTISEYVFTERIQSPTSGTECPLLNIQLVQSRGEFPVTKSWLFALHLVYTIMSFQRVGALRTI